MTGDRWISVSGAADFIETEDAEQLINQAWKRGAIRLQGVRPGESAPVEIPPSEEGAIDCTQSRLVVAGGLFATYDSVSAEWDGVLRLVDALREPPPEHIDEQE